jgi:hypothetical protein
MRSQHRQNHETDGKRQQQADTLGDIGIAETRQQREGRTEPRKDQEEGEDLTG